MKNSNKRLFAKFRGEEIFKEQGRLLFSLLNAFSSSSYNITLFNNFSERELDKYGEMSLSLKNLSLSESVPNDSGNWIYLFDEEDRNIGSRSWEKKIQVRFDVFSPYRFTKPIIMPFPVHPVHAKPDLNERLRKIRSKKKSMRVFFSGDTKNYKRNRVQYPKEKLTRSEIIQSIMKHMGDSAHLIEDGSLIQDLENSHYLNKFVLVDTNKTWVDDKKWLDTLALTDFFLCPPGIVMPMCHNIVEAMSVGAIPITNYPEWFDPDLKHLENCIVFDDEKDLIEKVNLALAMNQEQIADLRKNAIGYYESHLKPSTFTDRTEASTDKKITVLLITEGNMARKPSKLNKNSVLIKGTTSNDADNLLRRLVATIRQ